MSLDPLWTFVWTVRAFPLAMRLALYMCLSSKVVELKVTRKLSWYKAVIELGLAPRDTTLSLMVGCLTIITSRLGEPMIKNSSLVRIMNENWILALGIL